MDFKRLFDDYGVRSTTSVNRGWVNVCCPYCDTKPDSFNMGFPLEGDAYCNCWKCGGHDLHEALSMILRVSKREVPSILERYRGRGETVSATRKKAKGTKLVLPSDGFTEVERDYLLSRRYDPDYLHRKYGVVGGGMVGRWKFRIIIPIVVDGRLVSWTARSILGKERLKELEIPRYKNLSIEESVVNPKDVFFNMDNCRGQTCVLTEGAFDVMRFGDGFLCSLGTQLTQEQLKLLYSRYTKVFVMFDNECEAQAKAKWFGMQIASMGVDVEVVDAYSEFGVNDGGDCNERQVRSIRRELGL